MSLEQTERDIEKAPTGLDPSLDPSLTIAEFCRLESISKPYFYTMPDRPVGYFAGDSFRIPQSERLKWRARQMAVAHEVAARQSEAARARSAAGVAAKKNKRD
jgi:hypothetical protein